MVAFLMLGIIPGTNIEINFTLWLQGMVVLIALAAAYVAIKTRLPLILLVVLTIHRATRGRSTLPTQLA